LDAEALNNNIQTRLRTFKRKQWDAPNGLTVEDVDNAWIRLAEAERDRVKAVRDHINKLKDQLRKRFADAANEFSAFIHQVKGDLMQPGTGDIQEQLAELNRKEAELESNSTVTDLQELYKLLEAHGLEDENPYTDYTIEELTLSLDQVKGAIKKKRQFLENQLAASGKSNITQDQMNELKETFKHFDKDNSNALDKMEFRACLQSLGQSYTDEAFNKLFAELAHGGDKILFEDFVKYMIKLLEDSDDATQIKASFKILANDKPTISSGDMRVPPLADDDISYLANRMPGQTDSYDYSKHTDNCFA